MPSNRLGTRPGARIGEAGCLGQALPRGGAERVRDPRVAAVRVVFDDDEASAGREVCGERGHDLDLLFAPDEMEAVGRDEAIERRRDRPLEVGDERLDATSGNRARTVSTLRSSARRSRSTATIRPPRPSRSASASVNAPSPAPMSAQVPPGCTAGRSRAT
jgi:hypothetical protein